MEFKKVLITKDCKVTIQSFDELDVNPDYVYKQKYKKGDVIDEIKTISVDCEDETQSVFRLNVYKIDDEIKFKTLYDIKNDCFKVIEE